MILVGSALKGFAVEGNDGKLGTVSDFLFDDTTWKIRWMVVHTGGWLTGRKLLIHPSAISQADYGREGLSVTLSKQEVKDSPEILSDAPVSRQMEEALYGHYGLDPLWGGGNYLGLFPYGMGAAYDRPAERDASDLLETKPGGLFSDGGDPHLRSLTAVVGYHIQAKDGPIGHLENFLVDDTTWGIRYLIIATQNWWPGRHILMPPYAVGEISWSERDVSVRATRAQVKTSPAWSPEKIVDGNYEKELHTHYGWQGYG